MSLPRAECRHPDIQRFGEIRCCLSCGEAVFETVCEPVAEAVSHKAISPHYYYTPLRYTLGQEIRLIVLFAGGATDELVCDIVIVNLADRPAYEAVSYTWADANGNLSKASEILCRGKSIPITKNCDAALRRLRLQNRNRRLWIDAICINQSDISEKDHQVRLMSRIYMGASQVLAYLGVQPHLVTNGLQRVINYLKDDNATLPTNPKTKEYLTDFFNLPYFDRVWILQEVGLSQLVILIIGADEVRWTGAVISKTLNLSFELGIQPPSILRWNPASRPEEEKDELAVLSRGRNCSATDPRDKVFALLGLMHSKFSTQFGIDYSLSPEEVFTKLAIHCIHNGRFDVLQHAYHIDNVIVRSEGPLTASWVPVWSFKDVYEPPPMQFSQVDKDFYASLWQEPLIQPSAWLSHELPRGIVIEKILAWAENDLKTKRECMKLSTQGWRRRIILEHRLIHHNPGRLVSAEEVEYLAQNVSRQQHQSFGYEISERIPESNTDAPGGTFKPISIPYLRLRAHHLGKITKLLGNISSARHFFIPHTRWPALGSQFCQSCTDANVSYFAEDAMEQARDNLKVNIELYGAGRLVFATDHSVGFTRGNIYVGFSIWILFGADVPFILREVDDHYQLIGDCYLHRAGRPFPCKHCGADVELWPMRTEVIDLW